MNDDFIGRTFGENNQVEVVGWFGERRGYSTNPIPLEKLEEAVDRRMFFNYTPTQDALEINRQRVKERNEK